MVATQIACVSDFLSFISIVLCYTYFYDQLNGAMRI